ncbi:MAG: ATP-binding protein [Bacteroidota bacterium]
MPFHDIGVEGTLVVEDATGFIWIALDGGGLARYDGSRTVEYHHDATDSTSMPSGRIWFGLVASRRGGIWVGTLSDGVAYFDPRTETFQRYLPGEDAGRIFEASDGSLWASGATAAFRLDPATGAVQRFEVGGLWAQQIYEDVRGHVWLGYQNTRAHAKAYRYVPGADSLRGYIRTESDEAQRLGMGPYDGVMTFYEDRSGQLYLVGTGVIAFDADADSLYRPARLDAIADLETYVLFQDQRGHFWASTASERARVVYRFDPARPEPEPAVSSIVVATILEDARGLLWMGGAQGKVARVDPADGTAQIWTHDPKDPSTPPDQPIWTLTQDRSGVVWTYGANWFDPTGPSFRGIVSDEEGEGSLAGRDIRAIAKAPDGALWVGSFLAGLYRQDPATGAFTAYRHDPGNPNTLSSDYITALAVAEDGTVWVGTLNDGFNRLDPATGRVERWGLEDRPDYAANPRASGSVSKLRVLPDGRLEVLLIDGLFYFDPATEQWDDRYARIEAGRTPDVAFDSVVDTLGRRWITTQEDGLYRLSADGRTSTNFAHYPGPDGVYFHRAEEPTPGAGTNIHQDADGTIWIGSEHGLFRVLPSAPDTLIAQRYTRDDGLPFDNVLTMQSAAAGRLWVGTYPAALAVLDPATGQIQAFDKARGFPSFMASIRPRATFRDPASGMLYFGGVNGIAAFDPEEMAMDHSAPPVVVSGLRHYNTEDEAGTALPVPGVWTLDAVTFDHTENILEVDLAALSYRHPGQNRFAYRLEGFSDTWYDLGTRSSLTLTNLDAGDYTLWARAANASGVWSTDSPVLRVRQRPPWWQTWWAYMLYGLVVLGAGVAFARYRRERIELRHRSEMERLEADNLRELDQARNRFFANISHEFRTPLTLTIGPLDDVREGTYGAVTPAMDEQLALARRNAERVLGLINQILDVARVTSGHTALNAQAVDLGAFTAGLARSFAPLAERRRLEFDTRTPDTTVVVYADPDSLEKVLANLLSNAVKFTPEGGRVRVTVEVDQSGAHAGTARVAVQDTGPGIPASALPHVFDRFYRAEAAEHQVGTGIGLALARELAALHGGTVTAESEVGKGSTFLLTLPLGYAHLPADAVDLDAPVERWRDAEADPMHFTLAAASGDGQTLRPRETVDEVAGEDIADEPDRTTILVVDDHAEVRAFVRRHLERANYRVVEAVDGEEGLVKARTLLPDLVLSDVMMPGALDGVALCRALKTDPDTDFLPVVLLTARAAQEDRIGGLQEQADDYLTKPFDPAELRARVANLIAGRQRLRERFRQEGMALVMEETSRAVDVDALDVHPALRVAAPDLVSEDEALLTSVREALEAHIADEDFSVDRLAKAVGLSRSQLYRRLRAITGSSASEVIRTVRLERGAQLLAARVGTVSEVAYAVGFKSVSHFSNAFSKHYGCRPSAYPEAVQSTNQDRGA